MRDTQLAVWTRVGGTPLRMGGLLVTDNEARFSYTDEYIDTGLPGLSLIYPPALYRDSSVVHPRAGEVHPRLRALIPPAGEDSFQRKLVLAYLGRQGISPEAGLETDLALLAAAGHGGIGHIDVFRDDDHARDWYTHPDNGPLVPVGDQFGFSLKEMVSWLDADARLILESLGPTPSVGGAVPKLLVAIPAAGWDGRISLPTKARQADRIDVVLKLERSSSYPGLAALEALALDLHRDAGFAVPRYWHAEVGGMPTLAVERFDRDAHGRPLVQESLYSILAAGTRDIIRHTDGSLERVGNVIALADPLIVADKKAQRLHLFKRVLMALLTGNGDLHLENLSLMGGLGEAVFSPVYDPTPMRAYSIHDMLMAVPFGDYGNADDTEDDPLVAALRRFASHLGVGKADQQDLFAEVQATTAAFPDRLAMLASVPAANRDRLLRIHEDIGARLTALA